jgi:hypothetical protein
MIDGWVWGGGVGEVEKQPDYDFLVLRGLARFDDCFAAGAPGARAAAFFADALRLAGRFPGAAFLVPEAAATFRVTMPKLRSRIGRWPSRRSCSKRFSILAPRRSSS